MTICHLPTQRHNQISTAIAAATIIMSQTKARTSSNYNYNNNSKNGTNTKWEGTRPNLDWKSITNEEIAEKFGNRYKTLRQQLAEYIESEYFDPFAPLPSNLIPQGTPAWHKLRCGVTGSMYSDALGFFEPKSAEFLGLADYFVGHEKAADVAAMLRSDAPKKKYDEGDAVRYVFMKWGTNHEANAVASYLNHNTKCTVMETGIWRSSFVFDGPEPITFQTGASPDRIVVDNETDETYVLEIKCPSPFLKADTFGKSKNTSQRASSTAHIHNNSQVTTITSLTQHNNISVATKVTAVVAQNTATAPAIMPLSPVQKNDPVVLRYMKRKPHSEIPVYYIPQIQAQMYFVGVNKCHYASWTPTDGMSVIEIEIDKEYCNDMFYFLGKFHARAMNCCDNKFPQVDFFHDEPGYHEFLGDTIKLSKKAKHLYTVPADKCVYGRMSSTQPIFFSDDDSSSVVVNNK